jgi:hypothetical protein
MPGRRQPDHPITGMDWSLGIGQIAALLFALAGVVLAGVVLATRS